MVEGQRATDVAPGKPLESLDDMAAYVERTRLEEENIRRKREEVELQLLRMRQQEAMRRQQAIKLRIATELANAAVLAAAPPAAAAAAAAAAGAAGDSSPGASRDTPGPPGSSSTGGGVGPGGPPKKKLMVGKKSKRLMAVAAAHNLHRLVSAPAAPTVGAAQGLSRNGPLGPITPSTSSSSGYGASGNGSKGAIGSTPSTSSSSGSGSKALLSREDLIGRSKEGGRDGSAGPSGEGSDTECALEEVVVPKPIFILSDCTGESAARTVRAALNQFEVRCRTQAPAQIMIFRFVESFERVMEVIKEAAKEDALVVYTLVDPKTVKAVQTACQLQNVRYVDLWTTLLDTMEVHLNALRSGVPASLAETRQPKASLTPEYFRMIEAVEYTRKMDDGAHPQEWANADLVILGVSRCGKTPLSIYLGQRGYKVANLPLIPGCPVPKELFAIDQSRIVGLIIDPHVLSSIRRNRITMMGVSRAQAIDYAEVQKINAELNWARNLYNSHAEWPVLDVTLRGIEETAARILKLLNDRRGAASPQWVDAYHRPDSPDGPDDLPPVGGANVPEQIYGGSYEGSSYLLQGLY